jgi:nucleoside-diphosphate-sugar epimerase
MKVLVTGGAGYVGSVVTTELLLSGFEVCVLDKFVYGGESILALHSGSRCRAIHGDVRLEENLRASMRGIDAIVHLAAVVGEPACSLDETQAWDINFGGTANMLAVAREAGVARFIYVSTCSNYGVSAPNVLATEEAPLKPLSQYAKAKVEAEKLTLAAPAPLTTTVLRLGTICGLSPRMRFDLLISDMARAAALGKRIEIFAPEAWRPFLHIRDAARVIETCLGTEATKIDHRVFNVVGENRQKKDLADLVLRHFPAADIAITSKLPDLRDYRASGDRIRDELGFSPLHTVEDAFLETAAAVAAGVFRDPLWPGHSAIPDDAKRFEVKLSAA